MGNENNKILMRQARDSDRPAIAALQANSWRAAYAEILPADYLGEPVGIELTKHWSTLEITSGDLVMVAELDGRLAGFISVWCRPDPFIDNFHTRPDVKHRGIGSNLLLATAEQLLQRGHRTAHLWVITTNLSAKKFYERMGGQVTEFADREMFDHTVTAERIEWSDLSNLPAPREFK